MTWPPCPRQSAPAPTGCCAAQCPPIAEPWTTPAWPPAPTATPARAHAALAEYPRRPGQNKKRTKAMGARYKFRVSFWQIVSGLEQLGALPMRPHDLGLIWNPARWSGPLAPWRDSQGQAVLRAAIVAGQERAQTVIREPKMAAGHLGQYRSKEEGGPRRACWAALRSRPVDADHPPCRQHARTPLTALGHEVREWSASGM